MVNFIKYINIQNVTENVIIAFAFSLHSSSVIISSWVLWTQVAQEVAYLHISAGLKFSYENVFLS